MDPIQGTREVLEHLKDLIEDSDIPIFEIEKKVGFSRGYLSQILCGNIDLRYWHLLAVLRVLEIDVAKFFAGVFPNESQSKAVKAAFGRVTRDVVDVYGVGVESLQELRQRLDHFEQALSKMTDAAAADPEDGEQDLGGGRGPEPDPES